MLTTISVISALAKLLPRRQVLCKLPPCSDNPGIGIENSSFFADPEICVCTAQSSG